MESQRCYAVWPSPEQNDMGPRLSESFFGSESLQLQRGNDQQNANNATPWLVLTGDQLAN